MVIMTLQVQLDLKKLHRNLLEWWYKNGRRFPWRNTTNPYHILISEILLHRTRADQARKVYDELIRRFPTVQDLALSDPEEVMRILYPLGLHWRGRLLLKMAREIYQKYSGKIPSSPSELESLPGVGKYIASAVRCFAFNEPVPLLDTNTLRILGRLFGIKVTDSSRRKKYFLKLYTDLMDKRHPREFNYAMIDLGALVCTPKNPRCGECPLLSHCKYGTTQLVVKK